jgi:NAD(P)-dependent dehydrogenase (short-subunit alcohol dehydrogenase family)
MQLHGKVAFITGGASGIGLGMAEAFAARGMKLMLADIEATALERAGAQLRAAGAQVETLQLDVTDRVAMAAAADAIEAAFGGVDVVCNNAGVIVSGGADMIDYSDWDWMLSVNLYGVISGVKTFAPRLISRGGGHFVNTASVAGLHGMNNVIGYGTSKFAVVGLSECLRLDMVKHNVGVSVLCPGMVATALATSQRNRPGAATSAPSVLPEPDRSALRHIDPREVGEMTANGIIANKPYILTHAEFREPIEARYRALIEAFAVN